MKTKLKMTVELQKLNLALKLQTGNFKTSNQKVTCILRFGIKNKNLNLKNQTKMYIK